MIIFFKKNYKNFLYYTKYIFIKFLNMHLFIIKNFIFIFLLLRQSYAEYMYTELRPPKINAASYILIDYNSGQVLSELNADMQRAPASLTKMMTSYIVGKLINSGQINPNDLVTITKDSWMLGNPELKGSSLMFLRPGDHVSISELTRGIILQSGNDACVAIANYISGDQRSFVELMNNYAHQLNLKNTFFKNVHGLDTSGQFSSARDIALISIALIRDVSHEYIKYKEKEFTYNHIRQINRNNLLWDKNLHVDGIKTGHTKLAGYNLAASAVNNNMRLISVLLGSNTAHERDRGSKSLLQWGFRSFNTILSLKSEEIFLKKSVFFGNVDKVNLGVKKNVYLTIPKGKDKDIVIEYTLDSSVLKAPLKKYQKVGKIIFKLNNSIITEVPLVTLEEVHSGNALHYIIDYIKLNIQKFI
ncbi:D-alanyl-D-alanine carboxypeptidase (penicillin-binding protein 5) [Wigglesworthia glossinidia endosymbiont of Glossina morsitans morsitans (Yale colony)]|uniref:serine-type D-Ala-D-Ala carboxypeptidase n=2 Tax=Wigglesworthia glossinidia TaxID=51229 RepID=H6Q5E0_WIGGL|nr:D-alanyl-D-alanine carboxypeptidase (penicillin-binding protein 5) [Wigglesworthia glossinidia endosymbiont of Glossina morsitans morsitans (Yale colony)]